MPRRFTQSLERPLLPDPSLPFRLTCFQQRNYPTRIVQSEGSLGRSSNFQRLTNCLRFDTLSLPFCFQQLPTVKFCNSFLLITIQNAQGGGSPLPVRNLKFYFKLLATHYFPPNFFRMRTYKKGGRGTYRTRRRRAEARRAWFRSKVQKVVARRATAEATCRTSKARVPRSRVCVRAMRRAWANVAAERGTMRMTAA